MPWSLTMWWAYVRQYNWLISVYLPNRLQQGLYWRWRTPLYWCGWVSWESLWPRDCKSINLCISELKIPCFRLYDCVNYPGGYSCECPINSQWNFFSKKCDIIKEDGCNRHLENPCGDLTGKCVPVGATDYKCDCVEGYFGTKDCVHKCKKRDICGSGSKAGLCVPMPSGYECICTGESKFKCFLVFILNLTFRWVFRQRNKSV